ncbi:hypothetical protein RND81_12G046900 [Saponaria officinalis]|uniref:Uncharacterized protein n=1 Tax=Saponaria officinalis TaxID=3572 RepID=A0AAW1H4Y7_SAPOF
MANNQTLCIYILFVSIFSFNFVSSSTNIAPNPNSTTSIILNKISQYLTFDYIFQFGDSLNDVGNLRKFPVGPNNVCGGPPYGVSINKSTGRCSDGLLIIDYIAKFFHLSSPGAYLASEEDFSHGANFAVAGATALDADDLRKRGIISPITNASLSIELEGFRNHLNKTCGKIDELGCKKVLNNSLILLGEIGGNDVNFALFGNKTIAESRGMLIEIARTVTKAAEEIITMGATRIVIPGNFATGCLPIYLTLFETEDKSKYDEWNCVKYLNKFTQLQNEYLLQAIQKLQNLYPNVAIVYADYYSAFQWLLQNAASLGFKEEEIHKSCCGIVDGKYNYNQHLRCGMPGVPVCKNPQQRISFDGIHLTERAYFYMTRWLLRSIVPGILKLA